jgi:hypothetical protein
VVKRRGAQLMRISIESDGETSLRMSQDFFSPLHGVKHASATSTDLVQAVGEIDGRATEPFVLGERPSAVRFVDGRPAPTLKGDSDLLRALRELLADAHQQSVECLGKRFPSAREAAEGMSIVTEQLDPVVCALCLGGCAWVTKTCLSGAVALAAACGPFGFLCGGGAAALCAVAWRACNNRCLRSDVCCANRCGDACCGENRTCLNPANRTCCDAGLTPCAGRRCCAPGQACVPTGPLAGTCCPAGSTVCGGFCCPATSECRTTSQGQQFCCQPCATDADCGFSDVCFGGCCGPG